MLAVDSISKKFKGQTGDVQAVNELSFTVSAGEIVGLLGNNGSGKTTTIKMISGLTFPDSGSVQIDGHSVYRDRKNALKNIGILLEGNRNLRWRLTVKENCQYFGALNMVNKEVINKNLEIYLQYFSLSDKKDTQVGQLSRGMQQKAGLIVALIKEPKLLLLDEPFNGLDIVSRRDLLRAIKSLAKEQGIAILITSHQIDYIEEMCERVIIIDQGQKLVENNVETLLGSFQQTQFDMVFKGKGSTCLKNLLQARDSNLLEFVTENGLTRISLVGKEDHTDVLWEVLAKAKEEGLAPVSLQSGRPQLTYVYETILSKGEKYA